MSINIKDARSIFSSPYEDQAISLLLLAAFKERYDKLLLIFGEHDSQLIYIKGSNRFVSIAPPSFLIPRIFDRIKRLLCSDSLNASLIDHPVSIYVGQSMSQVFVSLFPGDKLEISFIDIDPQLSLDADSVFRRFYRLRLHIYRRKQIADIFGYLPKIIRNCFGQKTR